MKLTMTASILLAFPCLSANTFARVDPPDVRSCSANYEGNVKGFYSDTYAQKVAVKINDKFYYLSSGSRNANVRETLELFKTSMLSGARDKFLNATVMKLVQQ